MIYVCPLGRIASLKSVFVSQIYKSGPKSMQDGWCGDDMPLPGSRPTGWEEEEDVEIGMWNSNSSQELNSSLNWPPYTKKMSSKVNISRPLLLKL